MDAQARWRIVRIAFTTVYLMAGWLLFTGTLAPISLAIGLGFSLLTALLTYSLFFAEQEAARRSLLPRVHLLALYLLLIALRMYGASFRVLWGALRGEINPRVVHFRTRLRSDLARIILANSITLTPGTLTLDLDDDHLIVHWLDARTTHSTYAGKLIKGDLERLLKRIFG